MTIFFIMQVIGLHFGDPIVIVFSDLIDNKENLNLEELRFFFCFSLELKNPKKISKHFIENKALRLDTPYPLHRRILDENLSGLSSIDLKNRFKVNHTFFLASNLLLEEVENFMLSCKRMSVSKIENTLNCSPVINNKLIGPNTLVLGDFIKEAYLNPEFSCDYLYKD